MESASPCPDNVPHTLPIQHPHHLRGGVWIEGVDDDQHGAAGGRKGLDEARHDATTILGAGEHLSANVVVEANDVVDILCKGSLRLRHVLSPVDEGPFGFVLERPETNFLVVEEEDSHLGCP